MTVLSCDESPPVLLVPGRSRLLLQTSRASRARPHELVTKRPPVLLAIGRRPRLVPVRPALPSHRQGRPPLAPSGPRSPRGCPCPEGSAAPPRDCPEGRAAPPRDGGREGAGASRRPAPVRRAAAVAVEPLLPVPPVNWCRRQGRTAADTLGLTGCCWGLTGCCWRLMAWRSAADALLLLAPCSWTERRANGAHTQSFDSLAHCCSLWRTAACGRTARGDRPRYELLRYVRPLYYLAVIHPAQYDCFRTAPHGRAD